MGIHETWEELRINCRKFEKFEFGKTLLLEILIFLFSKQFWSFVFHWNSVTRTACILWTKTVTIGRTNSPTRCLSISQYSRYNSNKWYSTCKRQRLINKIYTKPYNGDRENFECFREDRSRLPNFYGISGSLVGQASSGRSRATIFIASVVSLVSPCSLFHSILRLYILAKCPLEIFFLFHWNYN